MKPAVYHVDVQWGEDIDPAPCKSLAVSVAPVIKNLLLEIMQYREGMSLEEATALYDSWSDEEKVEQYVLKNVPHRISPAEVVYPVKAVAKKLNSVKKSLVTGGLNADPKPK